MSDQTITLLILVATVLIFVLNKLPVGTVVLGVAPALWLGGDHRAGGVRIRQYDRGIDRRVVRESRRTQ